MAFYQYRKQQLIRASLQEVWDFMATPANLGRITPTRMNFRITSGALPEKMYPGMIIAYRVSPLPFMRVTWVTEITQVSDLKYFVDEQRSGPYRMWHHEHLIEETPGGVLMTDIVSYEPPLGFLGRIANALVIRRQVVKIFTYRELAINKLFAFGKQHV